MSKGERKVPATLPTTTEMMAASSSPPARRVMTTLEAMVVGIQAVTSMPRMMGMEGVSDSSAPAAIEIWRIAFSQQKGPERQY